MRVKRLLDGIVGHPTTSTARKTIAKFGIATECGMGRRPTETIVDLLKIHARAAALLETGGME